MMQRKRFLLLMIVGLISVLAMGTILAKDKGNGNGNGNGGNGNPAPTVEQNNNGNKGKHHRGGNKRSGGGNGGGNAHGGQGQPAPDPSSYGLLGCQKNNPGRLDCSSLDV